jgi:AcrR family transcriptional regulator
VPRALRPEAIAAFRAELCRVAERRFAEQGYAGVTLRALAAELGVSAMTPYRYFRDKEEIFAAVRTGAFHRFGVRIEEAAAGIACPIERIRALGRAYLRFALSEPHAYRIMFSLDPPAADAQHDPVQEKELRRGWQVLHDAIAEAVSRGLLSGDPVTLAHLAWLPLHGLVTLHLSNHLRLERGLEELAEPLLDHFFHGSAARPLRLPPRGGRA